jgi:hypothetical protein
MATLRSLVPAALVAVLSLGVAPLTAFADTGRDAARTERLVEKKGHEHHKMQFPIEAEQFRKMLDKRITRARARLEKALDARKVPDVVRAQVRKDFESGASAVRALADKAAADGVVTKEEAQQVRELAKSLKQQAKQKYGMGHVKGARAEHRGADHRARAEHRARGQR